MPFLPAHDVLGDPEGPLAVFAHGILGSRRNWRGFARSLLQDLPGWRVALVDHRHHGESHGAPAPHTVEACAEDLEALGDHLGPPRVVVGHSFGGKVALALAARRPAGLEQVWSLDAIPSIVPPAARDDSGPVGVIAVLRDVVLPLPSRNAVMDRLTELGLPPGIVQWMSTNLRRSDDGFVWTFDLDGAEALIADYFERDLWTPVEASDASAPDVEVVRAGRSDRWTPDVLDRFAALPPGAVGRLHTLPDAGHWVHVDDPQGLKALLLAHWAS